MQNGITSDYLFIRRLGKEEILSPTMEVVAYSIFMEATLCFIYGGI